MIRGRPIYLNGNDDEPEHALTRKATATGAEEAATGLTSLTFYLSATPGGSAIHGSLSKTASERGALGIYFAVFEGTDLHTQLNSATYIGKDVYQRFGNASDVDYWVVRRVVALRP
jgi:hypothetical protein